MDRNINECILQLGSDQFVVNKEAALRTFGSKMEAFLDTSSKANANKKYVIRRPKDCTMAFIKCCYTGQLHIPQSVCKGEFLTELQFWGIRYKMLEMCCYHKLCTFLKDQEMLKGFEKMYTRPEDSSPDETKHWSVKERVWGIVNCDRKSRCSKVYHYMSTTFVLLMIAVLAITSLNDVPENAKQNMSTQPVDLNCSRTADTLQSIGVTASKNLSSIENEKPTKMTYTPMIIMVDCDLCSVISRGSPGLSPTDRKREFRVENTDIHLHIPKCCKSYVKQPIPTSRSSISVDEQTTQDYDYYDLLVQSSIDIDYDNDHTLKPVNQFNSTNATTTQSLSRTNTSKTENSSDFILIRDVNTKRHIVDAILTTVFNTKDKLSSFSSALKLSNHANLETILCHYIERVITTFFTIEFVLRLISCPNKKDFFCGALNWLDFILLLGSFGRILLELRNDATATMTWTYDLLLYLQMFRVLRLFRMIEHVKAFKVLRYSLATGMKDICVLAMYVLVTMSIFANFIFFVENRSDFPSLPAAWWFSIVTMTTVGYGDMVPHTTIGKLIGCLCALSGVVLFSLIIPVFVSTFLTTYEYANESQDKEEDENKSRTRKHDTSLSSVETSFQHKEKGTSHVCHVGVQSYQCKEQTQNSKGNLRRKFAGEKLVTIQT